MNTSIFPLMLALGALPGCSSTASLYHDQPLVSKVDNGMSKEQVLQIGGKPTAESERTVVPGSCFDYLLVRSGQTQPYSVSFDGNGKVDRTTLMTCAEWSAAQQKARRPSPSMGGFGGSGY
ncbi:osmotically-inducible lipoprotein OsmE [Pseudomonas putida]|uniref:osmotically-inducible lipoprotein OsmE n=1 Tax=Pseudomonas putida TaxID=303 RepID=UPI000DB32C28|nr:osmotically-inducible lipoprotein OsmE [Pseudomonas putida]MBI6944603.1 osmotically-inducible lipoprotein OsmE [Pseudomonas putida]MBI6960894.1 osmotically-inducible lipoprotein OsmE [Pseudomonas putida]PZQ37784.1 MAG: osmotically-inducible lipoprotein OsmE [Pseudomonas putida]